MVNLKESAKTKVRSMNEINKLHPIDELDEWADEYIKTLDEFLDRYWLEKYGTPVFSDAVEMKEVALRFLRG
jgi:hypothetical protein